jgi:hypothetical protein
MSQIPPPCTHSTGKFSLRRLTKVRPKLLHIIEVQQGKSCSKMNSGRRILAFAGHGNSYCGFGVAATAA